MKNNFDCKSILAIGPRVKAGVGKVTGPSMMFDSLVQGLTGLGWEIRVINIVDEKSGIDQRKVGGFSWSRIMFYVKLMPKIWLGLINQKGNVYLVIAPTLAAFIRDALVIWSARIIRRKIICHLFGDYNDFFSRQGFFVKKVIGITLSQVDKIIVEGELVKNYMTFVKDYKSHVVAISNGLPERDIVPSDNPKSISNVPVINLLYMSNMIETKGYFDVLEAVKELVNDRGRAVTCRFAGKFIVTADSIRFQDPELAKSNFFDYIRDNRLERCVTYSESIFGEEKAFEFNKAHFFILPSNYIYEMQPVSILEAMAYGLVVLGTDHRLIPDMLADNKTGCIVPYNAPEVIADKIESLIEHPEIYEQFSKNSINLYHEKFSADIYCDKVDKLLHDVLCEGN